MNRNPGVNRAESLRKAGGGIPKEAGPGKWGKFRNIVQYFTI